MKPSIEQPSWRKPAGIFLIVAMIAGWAAIVVTVAGWFPDAAWPLRALYFVAAGIVWVLPLKPLLQWMETGRWRA